MQEMKFHDQQYSILGMAMSTINRIKFQIHILYFNDLEGLSYANKL